MIKSFSVLIKALNLPTLLFGYLNHFSIYILKKGIQAKMEIIDSIFISLNWVKMEQKVLLILLIRMQKV